MELTPEKLEFWENLYRTKKTPWDLGQPAPPLQTFLKSPYAVAPGRIAVLGCGRGHECVLFAKSGFEVTGIDFAPSAVAETSAQLAKANLLGTNGFLLERNIFDMHDYFAYYDYVLEHCSFCAIDPSQRQRYAWTVRDLLKPGGKFIALWWCLPERKGGPPFHVDKSEIFELFRRDFQIEISYVPQDSIKDRKGQELLTVMAKVQN